MLKQLDEHELKESPETGGIYAFHLRLIRKQTVGISGGESTDELGPVKRNLEILVSRVSVINTGQVYTGTLEQSGVYDDHGHSLSLEAKVAASDYLLNQISALKDSDLNAFVKSIDSMASFFQPLYVGIALKQSLQERYDQHKSDFLAGRDGTFGGRVKVAGLRWADLSYSCVPQEALRMDDESIRIVENYIQYLCRPIMGRS